MLPQSPCFDNNRLVADGRFMKVNAVTHSFFAGMSEKHLEILSDAAMSAQFSSGEMIFREGEPANRFYLIHNGQVELASGLAGRGSVPIQKLGAGDVLGWSWLFPPHHWRFNAKAVEPITATFFYGKGLREKCEENPIFGYALMKRISQVMVIHK